MLPSLNFEVLINSNQKYNVNLIKLENIFNFRTYYNLKIESIFLLKVNLYL